VLVTADPGGVPVAAVTLGLSGSADPGMQTVGVFCVVRGPAAAALRPGRTLAGEIETGRVVTGVVIPRSAVVRLDGADWVYVQEDADTFVRHAIVGGRPLRDGWLVAGGMPPGVAVVDRGAGSLIALERADAATGPE